MKNKYTPEQKKEIIDRYISGGESYSQISANTGIAKSTFYSWLKQYNIEREMAKKKKIEDYDRKSKAELLKELDV